MALFFTFSMAYLGLKVGTVPEAAIPIAILAVGLGYTYSRKNTILENVIIQSIGAASGALVAGAIFTIPACSSSACLLIFLRFSCRLSWADVWEFYSSFLSGVISVSNNTGNCPSLKLPLRLRFWSRARVVKTRLSL